MYELNQEALRQHDEILALAQTINDKRIAAIRNGASSDELIRLALEVDVLMSRSSFLLSLGYNDMESSITHELSWYDENGLFTQTDYRAWLNEDVNGIPRWLLNLNATLAV